MGGILPKTRNIAVWDIISGHMPIYYTNAPNLACPSMTEWFGRRDGLQEGNRLQDKSQQIIWLMAFGHRLSEWRGPALGP